MSQITQEELDYEEQLAILKQFGSEYKQYCRKCGNEFIPDEDGEYEDDELECEKCGTFNILN